MENLKHLKQIKINSFLDWRASQKRLFGLGYEWKWPNEDKWRDEYYLDRKAQYLIVDIVHRTIYYDDVLTDGVELVGLKEVK